MKASEWMRRNVARAASWWARNPGKHRTVFLVVAISFGAVLATGIISYSVQDATAIKHRLGFKTGYNTSPMQYLTFSIQPQQYQYWVSLNHSIVFVGDFLRFFDARGLYPIASQIQDACGPFASQEEVLQAILSFVQDKTIINETNTMQYISDPPGPEYPKYPIETLGDTGGDCEDSAILFACLVETLGYNAIIVFTSDHAFAAVEMATSPKHAKNDVTPVVYDGKTYYPCECTGWGWHVGELAVDKEDLEFALPIDINVPALSYNLAWLVPTSIFGIIILYNRVQVTRERKQKLSEIYGN